LFSGSDDSFVFSRTGASSLTAPSSQFESAGQLAPSKEYANQLPERISELQQLARKLEERMLEQLPDQGETN
jgi:hypothetical protein